PEESTRTTPARRLLAFLSLAAEDGVNVPDGFVGTAKMLHSLHSQEETLGLRHITEKQMSSLLLRHAARERVDVARQAAHQRIDSARHATHDRIDAVRNAVSARVGGRNTVNAPADTASAARGLEAGERVDAAPEVVDWTP
ncbi:MAG: hypothetical protein ACT4TC_07810, partial [Myxococcaceae bacterium]